MKSSFKKLADLTIAVCRLKKETKLSVLNYHTVDLSEISTLTHLEELFISFDGDIELPIDITPLSNLVNLTTLKLDLVDVKLTDIIPLSKLVNLTILEIVGYCNEINDLTPLSKLVNLTKLDISFNQITDLTPLSKLVNLTELDISENKITDFTPLSKLVNLKNSNGDMPYLYPLQAL